MLILGVSSGGVYPWAFLPLFAAAAAIGLVGLVGGRIRRDLRPLALALSVTCLAIAAQLVPVSRSALDTLRRSTALNEF